MARVSRKAKARKDDERKNIFLSAIALGVTVKEAAKKASTEVGRFYKWKREDPAFAGAWQEAWEQSCGLVESVVMSAALKADTGMPGAMAAAMFILKARDPLRYCDKARAVMLEQQMALDREKALLQEADAQALEVVFRALDTVADQKRALPVPDARRSA